MLRGAIGVLVLCACGALQPRPVLAPRARVAAVSARPARPPSIAINFDSPLPALISADDVAFVAEVSADEMTFGAQPGAVDVQLFAPGTGRKLFTAIRHNLPNPVAPDTTYRNVRVRVVIASSLPSAEELLRTLDVIPLPPPTIEPPSGEATP